MKVISLDIESYGACKENWRAHVLPEQRHFHPVRCLVQDGVDLESLALVATITLPQKDPRCTPHLVSETCSDRHMPFSAERQSPARQQATASSDRLSIEQSTLSASYSLITTRPLWTLPLIAALEAGQTMLLHLHLEEHRKILLKWLHHADTLIGVNLLFDIPILRMIDDRFRHALFDGSHQVLDFIYIRYLQSEVSRARSLKTFGPHHGLYVYDNEVDLRAGDRFEGPFDPHLTVYATSDPHNSITAVAYAAKLISEQCTSSSSESSSSSSSPSSEPEPTSKLSPACVSHYTDLWWSCVRFVESGIPMSVEMLETLEKFSLFKAKYLRDELEAQGITLTGKGSQAVKLKLIREALEAADTPAARWRVWDWNDRLEGAPPSIFSSPLIEYTSKKHELSATDANRQIALVLLPEDHPLRHTLEVWGHIISAEKLVSTYTYPLLRHHRSDPDNVKSRIITWPNPSASLPPSPTPSATPSSKSETTESGRPSLRAPTPEDSSPELLSNSSGTSPSTNGPSSPSPSPTPDSTLEATAALAVWSAIAGGNPHKDVDRGVGLAFPSIFPVPSFSKDGAGDWGGQKQSRLSFKNPSAQTFPPAVKACIRSRFKGGSVWWFDLSQIELRVAGILSGEPSILRNYQEGLDLHTDRCIDLFGEDVLVHLYGTKWRKNPVFKDNERQWGKKFNFEDLYLAGPGKMQRIFIMETGKFLPLSFFRGVLASRFRLRPVLAQWQEATIAEAEAKGHLELPFFGQSRAFTFGARGNAIGEIVNFPIQATAANVTHRILMALFRKLPRLAIRRQPILPFLNVYDAGALDVHPSVRSEIPHRIEEAVEFVRTQDYWAQIQAHYNNTCPLAYETKELAA
jgi:hypothetical protein